LAEHGIRGGATLALFAITAIMLVAELRTPRWLLPRILYIVGLAVMVGLEPRAAEFVSFPCYLDIATLDTRYGAGIANTVGGVSANNRRDAPISAQTECAAMGGRAFAHLVIARVAPSF